MKAFFLAALFAATSVANAASCESDRQALLTASAQVLSGMPPAARFDGEERMPNAARSAQVSQQAMSRILSESKASSDADKGATLNALMSAHQALVVAGEMKQAASQYDAGTPKYMLRAAQLNADLVRYADCLGAMLHAMAVKP